MQETTFWEDSVKAQKVTTEFNDLKKELQSFENINKELHDLEDLVVLFKGENDNTISDEVSEKFNIILEKYKVLELYTLFKNKHDKSDAIISIHSGTGGEDAQDWAAMLLRMFLRYCESQGFKTTVLDKTTGNGAGIKSAVVEVNAKYSYGYLKSEVGVHRLVRISPFDAEKLRQTSFALVEVIPVLDDLEQVKINEEDLKIDTFLSSGCGGQSVNTTYSAVRITHLPSKITVSCQNERSQLKNKEGALKVLKSRLNKIEVEKREQEEKDIRGEHKKAIWGNHIRSYVLHPYTMVKDHRTKHETSEVGKVLDGDLNGFVTAFLKMEW